MSSEVPGLTVSHEEAEDVNTEGFRATARELLCRIELLEKKQAMVRHTPTHMAIIGSA